LRKLPVGQPVIREFVLVKQLAYSSVTLPRAARIMAVKENHGPFGKIEFQ
jgi:hypothetical protein